MTKIFHNWLRSYTQPQVDHLLRVAVFEVYGQETTVRASSVQAGILTRTAVTSDAEGYLTHAEELMPVEM